MSSALLQASSLSIGYRGKVERILADKLDLEIHAGQFICLLGPNGAGKSTLLRTLAGIQAPLSGELQLSGKLLPKIRPRERARELSIVLTEPLSSGIMTARMLVALGRHPYTGWLGKLSAPDQAIIEAALSSVRASHLVDRAVDTLSDGERQKVAIARALAQESKLIFLDEPTAHLDLPNRIEVTTLLRELAHAQSKGILLSTHDLELALRFADQLWILSEQGLVQGTPRELAESGSLEAAFTVETPAKDLISKILAQISRATIT
jgi:iron complex transport system ATP-binding protein